MLISHQHKFLFVHIAKTGGTSIRSALTSVMWPDTFYWIRKICNRVSGMTGHRLGVKFPRHAKVIAAMEMLPKDYFQSLFRFTIVRNPWDLQVSSYHHIQRERPHLLEHISDFDAFLHWKLEAQRPCHYILDASTEPQWFSVIDLQGQCVLDYIGRYETLVDDFQVICERIGFRHPPDLPHKRQAQARKDYRHYYSDWGADLVARRYQDDIDNLGYRFG